MTTAMARVHAGLRSLGGVCVSFTVDPDRDTLPVLRAYADRFAASADAWWFLRGPQADVLSLSYGGFHIGDEKDPFVHSERIVLVDGKGRVRGYYRSLDEGEVDRLLHDAARLRLEH